MRKLSNLFIPFVIASFLPAIATAADFYASVYATNSWFAHGDSDVGMYKFSTDAYGRQTVMIDPDLDASGGGAMTDDFYFCTSEMDYGIWTDVTHFIINPQTWTATSSLRDGSAGSVASDLAYDPITAKIFGCFNSDDDQGPMVFGTIDPTNGNRFAISDVEIPWIACSVDRYGQLYAVDMEGNLLKVDKTNGDSENLGNLGFSANSRSTGAIDPATGTFYVVVTHWDQSAPVDSKFKSWLYAVDTTAAEAEMLYEFGDGEVMGGMWIPGVAALDGAPAQVEDLKLSFPDGSLNGTVSFTIPELTFGGEKAEGEVSYLLRSNDLLMAEGKGMPGEMISRNVKVDEAAIYNIDLVLTNSVGRSPKTRLTLWIGEDDPKPVTDVNATYSDGQFEISWKAPDGALHDGYYDPAKIRYTVMRQPGNVVVAKDLEETSATETFTIPDNVVAITFEVIMTYGAKSFPAVKSETIRLGATKLPWTATFEDEDSLKDFTVLDNDGDRIEWYREWEFYIEDTDELIPVVAFPYSSSNGADDWLFTPPFDLHVGREYELSIYTLTDYLGDEPALEILFGDSASPDGMTEMIAPDVKIQTLHPTKQSFLFKTTKGGMTYIGFHAKSEPWRSAIAMTEISLTEKAGVGLTESVSPTDAPEELYRLDGTRVSTQQSLPAGIYILRQGSRTRKIILR